MRKYYWYVFIFLTACQAKEQASKKQDHAGMRWIEGANFIMGNDDQNAYPHERPSHPVKVDGFWMDETEVTNESFLKFVEATGYVTVSEQKPEWEELKKQLPPGTPKPPDSILVAGSLTFAAPATRVSLNNYANWWKWTPDANWQQPEGKGSNLEGRWDHPVVHIAYEDAVAYCEWVGKRLPTEAEWELASREGQASKPFDFTSDIATNGKFKANIFQGSFPNNNLAEDGFKGTAPVKSFPPNAYGLYDMIGNVWEWTSDYYDPQYYSQLTSSGKVAVNPKGPKRSFDPNEPGVTKYVTKGGSYLCATDYCSNYRPSARQGTAFDSGQSHIGFRCVK
jgi:formylglycine-generating enzyme